MGAWNFIKKLVISISIGIFLAILAKYYFLDGGYEVTYLSEPVKRVCTLTPCTSGYAIDLVNTGIIENSEIGIYIYNVPEPESVVINVTQEHFPLYGNNLPIQNSVEYEVNKFDDYLMFKFKEVPPGWHIAIKLSSDFQDRDKRNWEDARTAISGVGSYLRASPYKVVLVKKVSDIINILRFKKRPIPAFKSVIDLRGRNLEESVRAEGQ
jgi:hypothetical protein